MPKPLWDGSLILDETKCVNKITWKTKTHKLTGFSTSSSEITDLSDLYRHYNEQSTDDAAQQILQFLWLDRSSDFDIIGPHYFSPSGMSHIKLSSCIEEVISEFHLAGFTTSLVIMDGAQTNLSCIKWICLRDIERLTHSVINGRVSHFVDPSILNPMYLAVESVENCNSSNHLFGLWVLLN